MKKAFILIVVFAGLLLFSTKITLAQGMMGNTEGSNKNLNDVVSDILISQNLSDIKNVDCSKVSDGQFEKLGDGWMDMIHGDGFAHEQMDNMMGGEGSDSLKFMHIQMGRNYLGCNKNVGSFGQNLTSKVMPDVRNGMMSFSRTQGLFLSDLVLISALAFFLSGTLLFVKNLKR